MPCFIRLSPTWVPEGSPAGFFGHREMALELVCGADFSWKLICGAVPCDLGRSRGAASAEISGKPGLVSYACFRPGYLKAVWRDFFGHREMALEFVRGADFSWKLVCGAGPCDLGGSRGSVWA